MTLPETLNIYEVSADEFGDATSTLLATVPAQVEEASSWSHGSYADVTPGTAAAWIKPHDLGALTGREVEHQGLRYRVVSESTPRSLITNEADLTELLLERFAEGGDGN